MHDLVADGIFDDEIVDVEQRLVVRWRSLLHHARRRPGLDRVEAGVLVLAGIQPPPETGLFGVAQARRIAAARRERAAFQRPGRIGRPPRDRRQRRMRRGIDLGKRRQQRLGVGHPHFLEQGRRRRALDHAAGIHHRDLVGAAGDDAEIVGDQDHRHVPAALLARQQIENLRLDRDVERGGRLVRDQQFRFAGQRDRNRHPLPHAAGELMRILLQPLLGRGNADRGEQFDAAFGRGRQIEFEMLLQRLDQLGADGQHRIERRHRVLEHHRERPAAQLAQLLRRQLQQVLPVEHHAAGELCLLRQQLQDRARQHGLAATGFADDAERPPGADGEVDMIDRAQIAARRRQIDRDILDGKQRSLGHSAP